MQIEKNEKPEVEQNEPKCVGLFSEIYSKHSLEKALESKKTNENKFFGD